jgi:hypothetical protein
MPRPITEYDWAFARGIVSGLPHTTTTRAADAHLLLQMGDNTQLKLRVSDLGVRASGAMTNQELAAILITASGGGPK